ncbi:MAG TPA: hypothetical protein VGQ10_08215 [Vicinamibacterales bacterium]|jgi:hypothetical protein|nr:hypothetical protein [Vicinamibacterales bacterium]
MSRIGREPLGFWLEPDPVIEAYKKDVDRTLIRENLKLTPDQRLRKLQSFMKFIHEIRGSARRRP